MTHYQIYPTEIGKILIAENGRAITDLCMEDTLDPAGAVREETPLLKQAAARLYAYLAGEQNAFDSLPLEPQGTDFQKKVWAALLEIPYGETISYKQLAEAVGNPAASRAVGNANGKNPIFVIIPCHRVIGANGALTGFAYGLEVKKKLLAIECAHKERP